LGCFKIGGWGFYDAFNVFLGKNRWK
jgi:hypothetical protein